MVASGTRKAWAISSVLAAVLAVVYLIFNEGYGGRGELAAEAIGRIDRSGTSTRSQRDGPRSIARRLDRVGDARAAYDRALELVYSDAERRFLEWRLAELQG